ncbi:SHOCT domain-containing protein [Nereida ignava]|uniref:SHOCT domain-containing protein n=1 Tax=Nereida ignava TaxID=282199 RepID=UPI003F6CDFE5
MRLNKWTAATCFAVLGSNAQADTGYGDGSGFGHMLGGGYGMFGGLMMLVFWGVIIALIIVVVRSFSNKSETKAQDPDSILKERFARGEIDEDEYRDRKATLDDQG